MRARTILALALTLTAPPIPLWAQGALDRSQPPAPGPQPVIRIPSWTRTTLANGAELVVTQKRDLPLVAFSLNIVGGAYNFEPADKLGVASFTAQMLSEGTATRTADQLSDAQQLLGTEINVGVQGEGGTISFTALRDKFEPAMALVADMMLHSTFPGPALERIRGRTLVQLQQAKDQPNAIAANVFAKVVYGDRHPYGHVTTEATVNAITRDDILAFHRAYYQPGRAVITVTGDVDPAAARAAVERAFAGWPAGGTRPTWLYPPPPPLRPTTIYLVDKPRAAQSVFAIGLPGPPRDTPDYYAIQVMNNLLGGLFQSRLNHNIREEKGYSYGVGSSFAFGRGPGAFRAGGGIITSKSDSALIEFMREFHGVRGEVPFTEDEITQGKESLVQSLPRRFSSVNGIGSSVAAVYTQGLPEAFYQEFPARINAVSPGDLLRVAKKYVDLDHLDIVIVGDKAEIQAPLAATKIAPIVTLDVDGKPVPVP